MSSVPGEGLSHCVVMIAEAHRLCHDSDDVSVVKSLESIKWHRYKLFLKWCHNGETGCSHKKPPGENETQFKSKMHSWWLHNLICIQPHKQEKKTILETDNYIKCQESRHLATSGCFHQLFTSVTTYPQCWLETLSETEQQRQSHELSFLENAQTVIWLCIYAAASGFLPAAASETQAAQCLV